MTKKTLIFDFDGTIADTHQFIIGISNQLASEYNYKLITSENLEFLKGSTSKEMIKALEVPIMKIPSILSKAKKIFNETMVDLKPFEGIEDVLHEIKKLDIQIGILSSNSLDNIKKFLKQHNLDCFDFVHTTSKVWSKNTALKKIIIKSQLDKNFIYYVGDETRDIVAAKKSGIKAAAVTWGYNSEDILKKQNPDALITKPADLINLTFP